jgi:hypothetical protein
MIISHPVITFLFGAMLALTLSTAAMPSAAKSPAHDAFERQFHEPVVVGRYGTYFETFEALTAGQRRDILAARDTLVGFFEEAEENGSEGSIGDLVDPELVARFGGVKEMIANFFAEETQAHIVTVTGFDLVSADSIKLEFYVVWFVEGAMQVVENDALLRRSGKKWLIVDIAWRQSEGDHVCGN